MATTPPAVRLPKLVQGIGFAFARDRAMSHWMSRYGHIFEINVSWFGRSVVVSDPVLVRAVCTASADQLSIVEPNLGNWFGPGSVFGLDDRPHRERRRLLAPAFHGGGITRFTSLIEAETLRECANWPQGEEFRILESMNRITLNVILRTVFGDDADGEALKRLRAIIPPYMKLGQLLAFSPAPPLRRHTLWGRLDQLRSAFDRIAGLLIERAEADPELADRTDILTYLLRCPSGGTPIPRRDLCDELVTLVCAGHETTASALAWTFERLRRHPAVLAELVAEVDAGGSAYRRATIAESLRSRTVIDVFGRRVRSPNFELGQWRVPRGHTVLVRSADVHRDPEIYPHPERFDPHRYLDAKPAAPTWLPFGGGVRHCIGADFALAEMGVILRTVLRDFRIETDAAPDEKSYFRGIAHIPRRGGRVVVHRRA